jgi:CRP-like cAMP-binding protein
MNSSGSDHLRTLRRLPLFNDLSYSELALIAEGVTRLHFADGTLIFAEGDVCRELLIVEEGEVKMIKSAPDGRQLLLGIERKGSALAEIAVFDAGCYPATAQAACSTTLLRLAAENFRRICVENPGMALKLFKVLAGRLRHLVRLVEELSFSTVRARLIAHLLRLGEQSADPASGVVSFQLSENNEELAARLGTVRELVSRNLGRLHGERLIEIKKRTVRILDLRALRSEMEGRS